MAKKLKTQVIYTVTGNKTMDAVISLNLENERFKGVKTVEDFKAYLGCPKLSSVQFDDESVRKMVALLLGLPQLNGRNGKIIILSDYDPDGMTGGSNTKLWVSKCYNGEVIIYPLSRDLGFSVHNEQIDDIVSKYGQDVDMLIAVDNGGKASDVWKYARQQLPNTKIVVIDHHDKDDDVENVVDLFVNPHYDKNIKEKKLFQDICGAFTTALFGKQVMDAMGKSDNLVVAEMLELSAVATVTDVMPVFDINRTVLNFLIGRVKNSQLINLGLKTLLSESKTDIKNFNSESIGFQIGPMLNAPGRLVGAEIPTNLLSGQGNILENAKLCVKYNTERKDKTAVIRDMAKEVFDENQHFHVTVLDDVDEGLIGIEAGNETENSGEPSVVFTKCEAGYKGSGRSPINFNIIEAATKVFTEHPELVVAYGGHPGAMGLTLVDEEACYKFQKFMEQEYLAQNPKPIELKVIDFADLDDSIDNVWKTLNEFEPYGQEFERPKFVMEGFVSGVKILAEKHTSFYLTNMDKNISIRCNWWKHVDPDMIGKKKIVFTIAKSGSDEKPYYTATIENVIDL